MGGADLWNLAPGAQTAVALSAWVSSHACAGAAWALVLLRKSGSHHDREAEGRLLRPSRAVLLCAAGLALPSLTLWLLVFTTHQQPVASLLRSVFGPWFIVLVACPGAFLAAWAGLQLARESRTLRALEVVALASSAGAVVLAGLMQGFLTNPSAWVEHRTLEAALSSPGVFAVAGWRVALAASLGSLAALALSVHPRSQAPRAHVHQLGPWALGAVLGAASILLASSFWMTRGGAANPLLGVPSAIGSHGASAGRMATVASLAAATCAATLALHALGGWKRLDVLGACALLLLMAVSGVTAEHARRSSLLPWSAPGVLYANGLSVEQVRASRHSPQFELQHSRDWLGNRMFELHCRSCHAPSSSQRTALQQQGFPSTRAFLEQLREADQYGSPYRNLMPPLIGSEPELDALARWLCGRP